MEQRLIELDKVLELIETCNSDGLTGIFCSYQDGKRFEQLLIKHIPTVEPIKGNWIVDIKDMDYCFCSECKHRFDVDHLKFSWDKYVFPPHCPNCGADMRGKNEKYT